MSGGTTQASSSVSRKWRLFRGSKLQPLRPGRPRERVAEEVVGHCPGCGTLVRFSAAVSPVSRCRHCETPLVVAVGGLDIETAVQARLYRATSSFAGELDRAALRGG